MEVTERFCTGAPRCQRRVKYSTLLFAVVTIVGMALAPTTSVWAQVLVPCPSVPNFTPDFSSNQNCLALNNLAAFGPPASTLTQPEGTPNPAQPAPQGVATVLRLTPNATYISGSAWYKTPVPVSGSFSTTFTFQMSGTTSGVGDGIAFLIQNSEAGTSAIDASNGTDGCSIGFGQVTPHDNVLPCTGSTGGIPNSLAIEFDAFQNSDINDVSPNHVAIQSCGTAANSVDSVCRIDDFDLTTSEISLANGYVHTATITYTPPAPNAVCEGTCPGTLDVILDGVDLFSDGGVSFDMTSIGLGPNGTALVGFTAATGGADDNQDILSWTFTPQSQTITQPLQAGVQTTFNFGPHVYKIKPNQNIDALSVTAVLTDFTQFQTDRNTIRDFPGSTCIIYSGTGGKCVEYHAVCTDNPNKATPPVCNNVSYDVVTSYDVPGDPNTIVNPGFLKATGQDCTPGITFDSNIITQFTVARTDPTTKGSSKPSFSCFVAVQNVAYAKTDLDIINLAAIKVRPNTNLSYISTVGNLGPSGAQGVAISNTIPSGTTYVSSALCTLNNGCSNATCSSDGTTASCQVGNLDKYGIEFMVTTVKVTATSGYIIDTAKVSAFNPDTDKVPDRSSTWKTLVSNR